MRSSFSLDNVRKPKRRREEQTFQARLVELLDVVLFRDTTYVFAVPNGGQRSPVEAAILRGQGVRAGVPDLVLIHEGRAFGLELKSKDGELSVAQRAAHVALRGAGMRIEVVRDIPEALERIREFGIPTRIKEDTDTVFRRRRAA